ncbi:uncharacterized protein BcabD6B2_12840 [Babesia caballi]|uniref:Uncharacterized protein n=1 Tax=Babesia caballi TaxID=5871 RepID=A0AAV4LPW2_BABCB|nr:hypothetical protein, conserved [Babesia caballi]
MAYESSGENFGTMDWPQMHLRLDSTFTYPQDGPRHSCSDLMTSSYCPEDATHAPVRHCQSCCTFQEAASININKTPQNTFLSIYGGLNSIWSNNRGSWDDADNGNGSSTGRSNTFEVIFRRSFQDDYHSLYSNSPMANRYSGFSSLANQQNNTTLSERLIEDSLRSTLESQPTKPALSPDPAKPQDQTPTPSSTKSNSTRPQSQSQGKASKHKNSHRHESKNTGSTTHRENRRAERKHGGSWRSYKAVAEGTTKSEASDGSSEITESASINNILEASEMWLKQTASNDSCHKKSLLKKHYVNHDQFFLGVS